MKNVTVIVDTSVKGDPVFKGEVIEVDDTDAKLLMNYGLVEPYEEPVIKEDINDENV